MFGYHKHHLRREGGGFGRAGFGGGPFAWGMDEGEERGRGGRRRVFDGGELKLVLLALLADAPRHGYDLIRDIEERTGGAYAPSPGVVYPTLTLLDELGHVDELKEEGTRKRFAISAAGRGHLAERQEEADRLLARLASLGEARARGDRAPIRRAMTGLHMAVREAAGRGDAERAHAIAALLDEAAQKVERLA